MVRNVKSHHEEQEDEDEEFFSRTTESTAQKANALRSKHSETEQRRRSKINERFQILRDLIPQNDQKRDKASCLLEVIQYIQFLQEKLQMYEGSYQGWSQEPSKLMHWNSVESDLDDAAYKALDHPAVVANQAFPSNFPAPSSVLGDVPIQPHQAAVSSSENLASLSQSQFWQSRACTTESAVPGHALNKEEELKTESGEASISDAYSQGLLNNLIQELQSSGVDLTQASISVQLDVGKRANTGLTATMSSAKDHQKQRPGTQSRTSYGVGTSFEDSDQAYKRLRTDHI